MKKTLEILLFFGLLSAGFSCAYKEIDDALIVFSRSEFTSLGRGVAVVQNPNGGYTVAGTTNNDASSTIAFVAHFDERGNVIIPFIETFDNENTPQQTVDMYPSSDGTFIIAGTYAHPVTFRNAIFVAGVDSIGDRTVLPFTSVTEVNADLKTAAVGQAPDGSIFILAQGLNPSTGGEDLYLAKTDQQGLIQYNDFLDLPGKQTASDIQVLSNTEIVILGAHKESDAARTELFTLKASLVSTTLTPQPMDKYSEPDQNLIPGGFAVLSDGSMGIAATALNDASQARIYVLKILANGTAADDFPKTFGDGKEAAYDIIPTLEKGFAIAGQTNGKAYLLGVDASGVMTFENQWGDLNDIAFAVRQTSDGGYILAGAKDATATQPGDLFLIKTDPKGKTD